METPYSHLKAEYTYTHVLILGDRQNRQPQDYFGILL